MSLNGDRRKKFSESSKRLSGLPAIIRIHPAGFYFPQTHFLRIVRGILLKGNGLQDIIPQLWQIALFIVVAMTIAVKRYRRTLG
jgi:ABC-type multidrug transport system permease subunit